MESLSFNLLTVNCEPLNMGLGMIFIVTLRFINVYHVNPINPNFHVILFDICDFEAGNSLRGLKIIK